MFCISYGKYIYKLFGAIMCTFAFCTFLSSCLKIVRSTCLLFTLLIKGGVWMLSGKVISALDNLFRDDPQTVKCVTASEGRDFWELTQRAKRRLRNGFQDWIRVGLHRNIKVRSLFLSSFNLPQFNKCVPSHLNPAFPGNWNWNVEHNWFSSWSRRGGGQHFITIRVFLLDACLG